MIRRDPSSKKIRIECDLCHGGGPWASWELLARKFAIHFGFVYQPLRQKRYGNCLWICPECVAEFQKCEAMRAQIAEEGSDTWQAWDCQW